MTPIDILYTGILTLQDYLSAHVLTCLIPAFFIEGAISVFIATQSILKYFGSQTKKHISYTIASVSGAILAVCSCTILPLFTGIYKKGAGLGPATTFLFSGPAINILAILLTAHVLGYELGLARVIGAITMAIIIGLCMSYIFHRDEKEKQTTQNLFTNPHVEKTWRPTSISLLFFIFLILILIIGAADPNTIPWTIKVIIILLSTGFIFVILKQYYLFDEIKQWMEITWFLFKKIFPILLLGVFIVGIISGIAAYFIPNAEPTEAIGVATAPYFGNNSPISCFLASIVGAILYMPTLLEVAIVGTLFGYSSGLMSNGPALSLLLAGPSLSLPNMIVITKVIGIKKASIYVMLVVIVATTMGVIYGFIGG